MKKSKILKWASVPISLGAFVAFVWLENRRPLRRAVESKTIRSGRNLAVAGLAGAALQLFENPVVTPLTKFVERKNFGLLKIVPLPAWLETIFAVVLLDYTLYVWHVLTHRVPFLWRFHVVHHIDLDLDATTAVRFHFAEMMISVARRAAQILLIGVSPTSFAAWQMFLFPSILFHHSNVRLPLALEKKLNRFIVTPRLHGIHHSTVRAETDSNWSSGLTVWDFLHGTLKTDVPQEEIIIGVPAYQKPEEVVLTKILPMPFEKQKPSWQPAETNHLTEFAGKSIR
jgi:sterol desaturase/sphingolipid hydroxylase (fatty acid hydroxylase superfamily)